MPPSKKIPLEAATSPIETQGKVNLRLKIFHCLFSYFSIELKHFPLKPPTIHTDLW